MLRTLVVLLALTSVALAAGALQPLQPKPDKFKDVEGCYIEELDEVIPFGKTAQSKTQCMEYLCGTDLINIVSCGVVLGSPSCKLVEDDSKPYPDCCPTPVC